MTHHNNTSNLKFCTCHYDAIIITPHLKELLDLKIVLSETWYNAPNGSCVKFLILLLYHLPKNNNNKWENTSFQLTITTILPYANLVCLLVRLSNSNWFAIITLNQVYPFCKHFWFYVLFFLKYDYGSWIDSSWVAFAVSSLKNLSKSL